MKKSFFRFMIVLPLFASLGGCGSEPVRAPEVVAQDELAAVLSQIVEVGTVRGELGELLREDLHAYLRRIEQTDAQRAETLQRDAKKLMKLSSSKAVKAKAKEMLAELESPAEE